MPTVLIVDDHRMFADGVQSLLDDHSDIEVTDHASNVSEMLTSLEAKPADIVLMDISLPGTDGIAATRMLGEKYPDIKVIVLSMHNSHDLISAALDQGANGYVLKDRGKEELVEAILAVSKGDQFYSSAVTRTIMDGLHKKGVAKREEANLNLTPREKEVLALIAQENTNQEIADMLHLSPYTIETHRKNLLSKLAVKNTAGLTRFAVKLGLVE